MRDRFDPIDHMNARRALMPASGGTNYARREAEARERSRREAERDYDVAELAMAQVAVMFRDFRSWASNLPLPGAEPDYSDLPF